jgi:iron complex outermembrane receptor protein
VGGAITSNAAAAAVYVDGVYEGVGGGYDLDRVEVLRGPQGTLYGRSATSGVVAIHSRNPSLDKFGVNASIEAGNYALRHYSAGIDLPLAQDVLGLRLSGNSYDRDGFYNGKGGKVSTQDGRAKLLYKPNDNFSLLIGAAVENNTNNNGGALVQASANRNVVVYAPAGIGVGKINFRQYWAEMNWNVGFGTLTYQPAYRTYFQDSKLSASAGVIQIAQTAQTPTDHFTTHELRLSSNPGSMISWQIGGLYYENKLNNYNAVTFTNSNALAFSALTSKATTATGLFAQATIPFAEVNRLTVGARYDNTKVATAETYTSNLTLVPGHIPPGGPPGSPTFGQPQDLSTLSISGPAGTRKFGNTTYKLRIEHDLSSDQLLYASISTGFSPGDVSVTTCPPANVPCVLPLDSETLTSYELGSKNRFLENRLQLNGDVFYNNYGAYQLQNINISGNPNNPQFFTFAVPVKSVGAELELLYQVTTDDLVGVNASYINAYYVNKPALFSTFLAEDKVTGRSQAGGTAVPPVQLAANYDHMFRLSNGSSLDVRLSGRYLSRRVGSLSASDAALGGKQYVDVAAQTIGDFSTTWNSADHHYSLSAFVRNFTDNNYISSVSLTQVSTVVPPTSESLAAKTPFLFTQALYDPRTYGLVFNVNF